MNRTQWSEHPSDGRSLISVLSTRGSVPTPAPVEPGPPVGRDPTVYTDIQTFL